MQLDAHSRLSAEDAAQRVLFASPDMGAGALGDGALSEAIYPGGHFRSDAAAPRRLAHLDSLPPRPGIREFLRHENAFAPLAPEQRANLDAAASRQAVFMLTGQQPGLLGGPILWYYKALTCAALAREWSIRLARPVIPIFWVAGDDADLDECNHLELLDRRAADFKGERRLSFPDTHRTLAIGERRIDPDGLEDLFRRLGRIWDPETVDQLRRAYPVPSTLSSGFKHLAQTLLGREGILFVDGYSKNLRALARPMLETALKDWEGWQETLILGTAAAAAAGIPAQVALRPGVVHAFSLRRGERQRLFARKTGPETDCVYTPDHPSLNLASSAADLELTHDVFSRPLVADALFPVLGHVLGPAELRYFAQLAPLFLRTTGDMPLVQPRMTATVAPQNAFDAFLAEGMELTDAMKFGPAVLRTRLSERLWRAHPASAALTQGPAERWLEGLRKVQTRHFKDAGPLDRFEKTLQSGWKRYIRALERSAYSGTEWHRQFLFDHLHWLGNGLGQDRHLGLGTLLNEIGRDGFAKLREVVDPVSTELQVFKYGGI
ncbi:MAG: bacillithiol biosynthesis BshC [Fibrobacteria bacterium]